LILVPPIHGCGLPLNQISAQHCTLIPEPFTLNRETGAKEEVSKIQDKGYGVQDGAVGKTKAVVVVLRRRCFFSELRVITLITKKYSIIKTTTTDYQILNRPLLAVPADKADQFFSQHPIIYRPTHPKNRTPTGGVSPLPTTPFSEIRRRSVPQKGAGTTQMGPKIAPIRSHFGG